MSRVEAQTGLPVHAGEDAVGRGCGTPSRCAGTASSSAPSRWRSRSGRSSPIGAPETWLHFDIYSALMSTVPLTGIIALSLTLVVIAREIDLSFGSVMAVGAWVFVAVGQPELGPHRRACRRPRCRAA